MKKFLLAAALLIFMMPSAYANEMRGVWVATVYGIDYPSEATTDYEELVYQANDVITNVKAAGLNTIFLQVRPSCDAIYPSRLFGISRHITGKHNADINGDILQYWVDRAHDEGIELHAWVNPYRVTTGKDAEYERLSETHFAKQHPEWLLKSSENYYLDPSVPEVRQLVCDGVEELLENYDIDGIHMDDYFYPNGDFDDTESYKKYAQPENGLMPDISDWRRNNVNTLIQQLDNLTDKYDTTFGISPSAVWDNKKSNPLGSDTDGFSSYSQIYADTRAWALNGWVDYIAPQIYFKNGNASADFQTLLDWWADTLKESNTKLYIGLGNYRIEDEDETSEWYPELSQQIVQVRNNDKAEGVIHFSYNSIFNYPKMLNIIKERYIDYDYDGFNAYFSSDVSNELAVCSYFDVNDNLIGIQLLEPKSFDNYYIREIAPNKASYAKCYIFNKDIGQFNQTSIKNVM